MKSTSVAVTNATASTRQNSIDEIEEWDFNPPPWPARFMVYAVQNEASNLRITVTAGGENHSFRDFIPFDTNNALSRRDHLVAEGVAMPGQRIRIGFEETGGTGTGDAQIRLELMPIAARRGR